LDAGRRDDDRQQQPEGIHEDVTLPPLDLLARVIAPDPPFSVVFTDWLSRMPALGWRCRPAAARTSPRSMSWMCCQVPSRRQRQKYW
jgi:hypothetical protein